MQVFGSKNRQECIERMYSGDGLDSIAKYLGSKTYLTGDELRFVDFYLYEIISAIQGLSEGSRRLFETYP